MFWKIRRSTLDFNLTWFMHHDAICEETSNPVSVRFRGFIINTTRGLTLSCEAFAWMRSYKNNYTNNASLQERQMRRVRWVRWRWMRIQYHNERRRQEAVLLCNNFRMMHGGETTHEVRHSDLQLCTGIHTCQLSNLLQPAKQWGWLVAFHMDAVGWHVASTVLYSSTAEGIGSPVIKTHVEATRFGQKSRICWGGNVNNSIRF